MQASSAAQTKITRLYAAVFTPMDSAMPAPLFSARMARPGREFSRFRVAHSASSTSHTPDHIGMVRPRNVQSMLPQLPVPVSTVRNTSSGPMVSRRKLSGGPQVAPISGGSVCT
ncbi:hypothetical protein G6F46_014284 [Rhizopus delemar]|nr:hypothetical protein G6F46_014284 [Rhizopus delemar]